MKSWGNKRPRLDAGSTVGDFLERVDIKSWGKKRWATTVSAVTLVSVVIAACTGVPGQPAASPKPAGAPAVAPVSVGAALVIKEQLSPTLSYSGNVQAHTAVNLVPKISARVEKLNADIGDEVKAGDVIAELDHAQLDAQTAQAEASVNAAQAKLEQTQASAKQEDVDAAQAVVDQAQAKLQQARAGGRPEDVAVAQAQATQALARADQVSAGARDFDRANLQAAIDQAEAQQDQLRAQLTTAQYALNVVKYRLEQARAGQGGPGVKAEDIAQAQLNRDTQQSKLDQLKNPRPEDIRSAELAVDKAKNDLEAARDARDNCGESSTTTRNNATTKSSTGTTTSSSKSTSKASCPSAQKDQLDALVDSAKVTVESAQNNLQKVRNPSPYDVQQAELAVATADSNLQKLRFGGNSDIATLQLAVSAGQSDTDRLQGAVDQATSSIAASRAKLDAGVNPDPNDIRQAVASANAARANVAKIADADPFVVQNAKATYDQANAQLGSKLRPFTQEDIRVAASAVDQAAAALLASKVQAAEAIIVAPFDAAVSQKLISPGAMASPNTPILALVSKDIEVLVQVEEARLGQLQKGQPASLAVSAYPGKVFPAMVAAVAPSADAKSRTFAVRIVPSEQDGTLRDGMFAQVSVAGVGQQALLVPNEAIVTKAGRSQVFVVVNDKVQAREVKLGETDGKRTAVLDGKINPGEEVVVTNPEALTDGAAVFVEQHNLEPKGLQTGPASPQGAGSSSPSQPQVGPVPGTGGSGPAVTQPGVQIPQIQAPSTPVSQAPVNISSSDQPSSSLSSAAIPRPTASSDGGGVGGGLPNLPSLPSTGQAVPRATPLPDNTTSQLAGQAAVQQVQQSARPTATSSTGQSGSGSGGSASGSSASGSSGR